MLNKKSQESSVEFNRVLFTDDIFKNAFKHHDPPILRRKSGNIAKKSSQRKLLEVDFVVNEGSLRYYIQSALALPDEEKRKQETASLLKINDTFKKVIVVKDDIKPWRDENGILTIGLLDFLMDENCLNQL